MGRSDPVWEEKAKRLLKAEMARANVTNAKLAELMTSVGAPETELTVKAKVGRGTFGAAFLLAAMHALGRATLHLD